MVTLRLIQVDLYEALPVLLEEDGRFYFHSHRTCLSSRAPEAFSSAYLKLDGVENIFLGADVRDKLFYTPS
jgi:hypothetical protein